MLRCLMLTALLLVAEVTAESRMDEPASEGPVEKTEVLANTSESEKLKLFNNSSGPITEKKELFANTSESPTETTELLDNPAESPTEKKEHLDDGSETLIERDRFFIGNYQTMTQTLVSFTTSTVYPTCLFGFVTTAICSGRSGRRKRQRTMASQKISRTAMFSHPSAFDIASSKEHNVADLEELENEENTVPERFFTVWTQNIFTTTLTTYSTNTATTLSLSYYCSAGSIDVPFVGC